AVVDELVDCTQLYERVSTGNEEYASLQAQLEDLFKDMELHLSLGSSLAVTSSIKNLCRQEFLNQENRLKSLFLAPSARYHSFQSFEVKRGECTPGTRAEVFNHIYGWLHNNLPGFVYWLNGMAGTGKTTIAYTLCRQLDENQRLAASFFCSRAFPECRNTKLIIPTIAYQLARFSHPFKLALLDVLDEDPDVHTCLPHAQFTALIVKPLTKSRDSLPLDIVVVVDALDECDDKDGTRCILEILLTQALGLPIKFFLSSRPEPAIRDEMSKPAADQASSRLVLHELEKNNVQMDIKTYMKAALAMVSPTNQQIATLVERSGILFIYAATVVRFIAHDGFRQNPQRRLGVVLNMSSTSKNQHKELDNLYTTILRAALDDSALEDVEKEDMKQVLYTVLCAQEPLSIPHLSRLLRLDSEYRVDAALRPLRSVLHVQEASKLVTVLHVSFVEYMLDSTRSLGYHCDSGLHNHVITKLCFECIQETRPRFNICRLESSYVRDDEVEDIEARVTKAISAELFYSCQYWATHLTASKGSTYLAMPLENFLRNHLLLWIEVMNLKRCIHKGPEALHKALRWGQDARMTSLIWLTTHGGLR
ncbi:unnamed protein product, partial [Rhizoctonia solani]